jgi:hypothetical protein
LVEFALDMDPTRPDVRLLPQPYVAKINGLSYLSLTWQPRDAAENFVDMTPQESTALTGWATVPTVVNGANGQRTIRQLMRSEERTFFRLRVEKLP